MEIKYKNPANNFHFRTASHLECMRAIRHGEADITVLDAGDVYRAGFLFGLIPIMAEVYNLDGPYYYAVAVTKQRDNSSELIYLKTKNTCHTVSQFMYQS